MSPRATRARRASNTRRTIWLATGAVVLGASGVTAVAVTGSEETGARDNSRPVKAHTLALDGKDTRKRELPRTETQLFSLVGVSWDDSADDFEGTAQIRTRGADDGVWTDWHDLDFDIRAPESDEGDSSGVRGASEPLWVGPSDGVEARVVADGKETAVPKALRLDMIDPGETAGDKGQGKGNGKENGKGKPSPKPKKSDTAAPSPSAPGGETSPSTAPEPTASASVPAEEPPTEQPDSPTAPAPSEEPQEPTAEPSPSEEPTTGPTAEPTQDPTPPAPSQEPTQDPTGEPTAEPSAPAPSEEPTTGPTAEPTQDPTAEPTAQPSTEPSRSTEPAVPAAPAIVSRADWGADESLVEDPPAYLAKADAVFVHHTAGTNTYSCADSPAIVRAILTYHVKTNGWNDVGYNFFVDKCGTVFEGRAGGVDKPVRGAHTYGFNGYSAGISVLGDYENGGTPTAAAKKAVADVAAWKLGLHGVDPEAKVTLTAAGETGVYKTGEKATLNTVSGHRDGVATLCPGATLYSALPEIRRTAGASVYAAR